MKKYPYMTSARIALCAQFNKFGENVSVEKLSKMYGVECDEPHPVKLRGDMEELYDVIYAPDPATRLPSGDVAVFLNKNTSPEIREFIRQNLMSPLPAKNSIPPGHEEEAFELMRKEDESRTTYAERISKLYQSGVNELQKSVEPVASTESKSE